MVAGTLIYQKQHHTRCLLSQGRGPLAPLTGIPVDKVNQRNRYFNMTIMIIIIIIVIILSTRQLISYIITQVKQNSRYFHHNRPWLSNNYYNYFMLNIMNKLHEESLRLSKILLDVVSRKLHYPYVLGFCTCLAQLSDPLIMQLDLIFQ